MSKAPSRSVELVAGPAEIKFTEDLDIRIVLPGVAAQAEKLKQMAADDPEMQCVGDLDGGPGD